REMSYIQPLLETLGIERRWIVRAEPGFTLRLLSKASSVAFPVLHPALLSLPRLCEEAPIRVLVGGELADSVCGSRLTTFDWAVHTSPLGLLRSRELPFGSGSNSARWLKHRILHFLRRPQLPLRAELPAYIHSDVRKEYQEWFARYR